jgi:uncharacterized membrane protein
MTAGTSGNVEETGVLAKSPDAPSTNRTDVIALATLGALFAVAVTAIQAHRLARFEARSFDLAIFAQGLWNLSHGHTRSSIQEASFFAVHFSPLMFALAPLARLADRATPLLLVLAQGAALGASAPLARRLARGAGRGAAFAFGLLALAQPAVRALALDGFHDVALGVPLALLLAIAIAEAWSARRLVLVALATALLADEVFPLVLPGAAAWLLLEGRRREAGLFLAISVATFGLVDVVLLGALRGGALHVESFYDQWRSPAELARFLRSGVLGETLVFALALLGPLAFLPLARARALLPAALVFALQAASRRAAQRSILEHYHAPITPFAIAAAGLALARLEARWPGRGGRGGVALVLAATLVASLAPRELRDELAASAADLRASPDDPRAALVARVPREATALASVDFLAALSAREHLLGLPGAVRGTKDWSSVPYELPELDSVLFEADDTASFAPALDEPRYAALARPVLARWESIVLDHGLGVVALEGSAALLGRGGPSLVEAVPASGGGRPLADDPRAPRLVAVAPGTATWAAPSAGEALPLHVEWSDGRLRPLLWRLYRARSWPPGMDLREHVPTGIEPRAFWRRGAPGEAAWVRVP